MTKHSEQQFVEFMFQSADLKGMPKQHSAYMVATSFAINEILVFLRLTLLTANSLKVAKGDDERLAGFAFLQDQILMRSLSARAVEYLKLAKDHRTVCERAKDTAGLAFFETYSTVLDGLWDDPVTAVAITIRNKLTGHVELTRIRDTISGIPEDRRETGIYLHQKDGNSIYLMGEDIAHIGAFESSEEIQAWSDWVLNTCRAIQSLHHAYMIWAIETFFPEKIGQEIRLHPDSELVGTFNDGIPVLWDFPYKTD